MKNIRKIRRISILGGLLITAVGLIVIPPLVKKCSEKLMKQTNPLDDVDFDDLGPEIVRKEETPEEE